MTTTTETSSPTLARAAKVIAEMSPVREGDIIPLLQRLQDEYGYLPREVILEVARETGLPASRVYGVATFYAQFRLHQSGRHIVRCCRGTACHVKGGKKIAEAVKGALGVEEGATTPEFRFTFETVACLGTCFLAPVMMVNNDYFGRMTPSRVKPILERYS